MTWTDPDVSDNSGLDVTLTSDVAKGAELGPGFHVIRITATDMSGNAASCNFVVTMEGMGLTTAATMTVRTLLMMKMMRMIMVS